MYFKVADPTMIIIPPVDQYAPAYTFLTPEYSGGITGGDYQHNVMLVIKENERLVTCTWDSLPFMIYMGMMC